MVRLSNWFWALLSGSKCFMVLYWIGYSECGWASLSPLIHLISSPCNATSLVPLTRVCICIIQPLITSCCHDLLACRTSQTLLGEKYRLITGGWPRHMLFPPLPVLLWAFSYLPVGMLGCVMCLTLLLFGLHPGKAAWHRHLIQALDFVRLGPGWLLGWGPHPNKPELRTSFWQQPGSKIWRNKSSIHRLVFDIAELSIFLSVWWNSCLLCTCYLVISCLIGPL